jgi:hypothetical protein
MKRAAVLLLAAAVTALLVGPQIANAHSVRIKRSTTVEFQDLPGATGDRVFGQLSIAAKSQGSSPALASRCLAGQQVLIKHTLTAPHGGSEPVKVLGTAITDAQGAWEFTSYEANGISQAMFDTFQIEVPKHPIGKKSPRHQHICLAASGFVTILSD